MVPRRRRVPGLPGVAAVAGRVRLPTLWCRVGGGLEMAVVVRGRARRTSATAGTIFDRTRTPLTVWFAAGLVHDEPEERDLRARAAAGAGAGLVPDGVGDAAPLSAGDGPPRAGAPDGPGGGRRGPRRRLTPGRKGRHIGPRPWWRWLSSSSSEGSGGAGWRSSPTPAAPPCAGSSSTTSTTARR